MPTGEFLVAGIPLVFTNEIEMHAEASAEIEGSIGYAYNASFDATQGFQYDSKTGKVEELMNLIRRRQELNLKQLRYPRMHQQE